MEGNKWESALLEIGVVVYNINKNSNAISYNNTTCTNYILAF